MHNFFFYALVVLLAANVSVYGALARRFQVEPARAHFLSVGQGDAELINSSGINFLIDAGPSSKTVQALDAVLGQERRTLDVVVLTHPNSDHVAGLIELATRYDIRMVITNGIATQDSVDAQIADLVKARHIPVVFARQGMDIVFGQARFFVLWPGTDLRIHASVPERNLNDTAIAGVLLVQGARALFTGDISSKVEARLASMLAAVDLLKVAHHGSKTSTSAGFLSAVQPTYAVIESGKNSYGLPAQDVLARLRDVGAKIFRTDADGTVTFSVFNGAWIPD